MMNPYIKIIRKIKDMKIVRYVLKPLKEHYNEKKLMEYHQSIEPERLKEFHNRFYGERCFIIGNGPSLKIEDLEKIQDEYSFASNAILSLFDKTIWRPTFYTCIDTEALKFFSEDVFSFDIRYIFLSYACKNHLSNKATLDNLYFVYPKVPFKVNMAESVNPFVSEDISKYVSEGKTITFINIQLAIYMGFKEIYLIGVDHKYGKIIHRNGKIENNNEQDYAKDIKDYGMGIQLIESTTEAYMVANEYCEKNGIKIRNATRGGKLEVFERVDFDSLFPRNI